MIAFNTCFFYTLEHILTSYVLKICSYNEGVRNVAGNVMLNFAYAGLILGLRSVNKRRRYFVTTSLICLGASLESALLYMGG